MTPVSEANRGEGGTVLLSSPLTVIVNTREVMEDADRAEVRKRGGVVVEFARARIVVSR